MRPDDRAPGRRLGRGYLIALVAVAIATIAAVIAGQALRPLATFFPFLLAVTVAALMGGFGPGVVATALAGTIALIVSDPFGVPLVGSPAEQSQLLLLLVEGLAISILGEVVIRGKATSDESARSNAALLDAERDARSAAERAIARADGLQATAAALGRALRTDEVAEVAVREGLERLGAGKGMVGILDRDGHTIHTVSPTGFADDLMREWATFDLRDDVPLAEAMRLREPLILWSTEQIKARYPKLADRAGDGGPAVVVPMLYEDQAIGGMYFRYSGPATVAESDKPYFATLGRQCAAALVRARLYEAETTAVAEAHRSQRGQEAVARLGQLALTHRELVPLFDAAAKELADVLDADITAIMQHVKTRHTLKIIAGTGWRDGVVGVAHIADSESSHAGYALVSDAPVVSRDYRYERRFRPSAVLAEHGARSGATTPILGPDGPWGVIGVHGRQPGRFDEAQIALLVTFANVLASAISRSTAETKLRDRDERLELALAASRTGFWEWNVRTDQLVWSDEICRLHGRPPGTVLESLDEYMELVHPEDREWLRGDMEAAAEKGAFDARYRIVHPDGTVRWTQSTAKVFFDVQHRAMRMVGVARDVTEDVQLEAERIRMVEQERRANELGQAFIGVVSHELRTPITSIFAGSKLLRRMNGADPRKRAELTADIEAEAERLYRLTEDLLVLTRVERGGLEIALEPVALPRLLERVIGSEQERWPLTTIELDVRAGIPIALGDNTYIEQLIRNLVGNAAKYAPEGASIQVIASATRPSATSPSDVEVRVLDRGPGLAETDLEHLFDLFYRSPLTAKKAPGAGIGLFVSSHLARAMGGRLWAANREGGGAEFGFSLRAYVSEAATTPELVDEAETVDATAQIVTAPAATSTQRAIA